MAAPTALGRSVRRNPVLREMHGMAGDEVELRLLRGLGKIAGKENAVAGV